MVDINDLAAALDGHQVTDEQGQVPVETDTTVENPAAPEAQTTVDETAPAEKPTEPTKPAPKAEEEGTENELAVDDAGKRYIPEDRFNKVYGKAKANERENAELKQQLEQLRQGQTPTQARPQVEQVIPVDRTEALEVEILKGKLPQFDPESESYDPDLDQLGAEIFKANPGITRMDAARKALNFQNKLVKEVAVVKAEARTVKAIQSDQGITSHVTNRGSSQVNTDSMSVGELENYLKQTGQW